MTNKQLVNHLSTLLFIAFLACILPACTGEAQSDGPLIRVQVNQMVETGTPVYFSIPEGFEEESFFMLTQADTLQRVAAQRWNADSAVFLLQLPLDAGEERAFQLSAAKKRPASLVALTMDSAVVRLRVQDKEVLTYHRQTVYPPPGAPDYYQRSGHVHPLHSPSGRVLTDGFPVGHTHQHGLFMTWVNTTFRGDFTDFWNQQNETATVRHVEVLDTLSGPVFGRFRVKLEHVSLEHGAVLSEERTFTVYPWYGQFLMDIHSVQEPVTSDTLFINEYHYGGMAFRGSAQWNAADSAAYRSDMQVLTSEGIRRAEANHTRPRWVAAYGPVDGENAGVAILDHPSNFRFPQPVRVHPEMPYFCFAPMVTGAFTIAPGDRYVSRYRLMTYDGEPPVADIEEVWQQYAGQGK